MKQHPIPQNILDIEFKLFTRFTVREFIYIATGVVFGGIFLYLFSRGTLPALIAIPIFLLSSGTGLFLGLVPINDQNADVYLRNFFSAIRRPTQRVWKSKDFDQKVEITANSRGISMDPISPNGTTDTQATGKIIGGTPISSPNQFILKEEIDSIDLEEEERLRNIEAIASETADLNVVQSEVENTPQQTVYVQPQQTTDIQPLYINKDNIYNYAIEIEGLELLPNSLNMHLTTPDGTPIQQATVMIKKRDGSLVQVVQSNVDGLVLNNRSLESNEYLIQITHDMYTFPQLYYILEGDSYPAIRISSI